MKNPIISWTLRLLAAAILGQTLFFKFTGSPESVEIFTRLEMEPVGRFLIGFLELATAVLLLCPRSVAIGAMLGTGIMCGAVISHITTLGWSGDMLILAVLALIVLVACLVLLMMHHRQVPLIERLLERDKG